MKYLFDMIRKLKKRIDSMEVNGGVPEGYSDGFRDCVEEVEKVVVQEHKNVLERLEKATGAIPVGVKNND